MRSRTPSLNYRWYTALSALLVLGLSMLMLTTPLSQMRAAAQRGAVRAVSQTGIAQADAPAVKGTGGESDISVVPGRYTSKQLRDIAASAPALDTAAGGGGGGRDAIVREAEPNDTAATAMPLNTNPIRVRADSYKFPVPTGGDIDVYSFYANAGDRVFANTMTSFSPASTDTVIDVLSTDGTTVLETDDEDGGFSGSSSNIAGLVLPNAGTYYVRVKPFTTTLAGTIRSYDLYVRVVSGAPTPEVEPNNNGQTPNPLPANGFVSGVINPAADSDTYSLTAQAGDTINVVMDVDPERDAPEWDGRLGIGLFDNNFLVVNSSAVGGTFDDANPSEAIMLTVNQTGTYVIYVDNPAGSGAANFTYTLAVSVIKPNQRKCTLYTGGTTGAITDGATNNFTLNVPDSRIIGNLQVLNTITHSARADLDVSLIAPDGNEVVMYDDPSAAGTVTAPQIDFVIDDEAANIVSGFGINKPIQWTPEPTAKLDLFRGEQAQGTWTLRVRDDTVNSSTGAVNAWSLNICEDPNLLASNQGGIFANDFELTDGGFTHSGTLDEWERGTPTLAPITTCHSGANCWKTDLDGIYEASSNQDLLSPAMDLTSNNINGQQITAQWWQKYQMDTASNDTAYVEVREVGNPSNFRRLWEWKGALMTRTVGAPTAVVVNEAGGWGRMQYDISDFGGKVVQLRFHLESGTGTTNFAGLAIDDVVVSYNQRITRASFTADARTDVSVWRPSNGNWFIVDAVTGTSTFVNDWGRASLGDIAVPGDYSAPGFGSLGTDVAIFRPSEGNWYIYDPLTMQIRIQNWGGTGDIPVPGDYDNDGSTDFAVFRPSDGNWYVKSNQTGASTVRGWGASGDKPVPADYDGDGSTDLAVFRPSDGNWYIIESFTGAVRVVNFGTSTDQLVPADYDGDRKDDIAVWRPSTGEWFIIKSSDGKQIVRQWGNMGDIPVPGKYDADNKYDIAIFRPSEGNWYAIRSTDNSVYLVNLGQAGDVPVPSAYVPQ